MKSIKNLALLIMVLAHMMGCVQETKNLAIISADKLESNWWNERHHKVIANNKTNPELILIGNSILNSLDDKAGIPVWEKYLDKFNVVNMGFSGDRTENVIWRLQNGEINDIDPKLALVLIGTNNTDGNHYLNITQPEELAEGIWEICRIIREKLPKTQILLLGIFPYGYKPNYRDNINKATNMIISGFPEKDKNIHYRDISPVFLDAELKVKKSLMPDYLHPNTDGYLLMFEALENDILELMN